MQLSTQFQSFTLIFCLVDSLPPKNILKSWLQICLFPGRTPTDGQQLQKCQQGFFKKTGEGAAISNNYALKALRAKTQQNCCESGGKSLNTGRFPDGRLLPSLPCAISTVRGPLGLLLSHFISFFFFPFGRAKVPQ